MMNTGSAVKGLPNAFAVRYVVMAISETSNSSVRTMRRNAPTIGLTSTCWSSTSGIVTVPSFRPRVCGYVAIAVLRAPAIARLSAAADRGRGGRGPAHLLRRLEPVRVARQDDAAGPVAID